MAKRTVRTGSGKAARKATVQTYRHDDAKRTNNPPAKIAAEGTVPAVPKAKYAYSPRRPPTLRFDPTGAPDPLFDLLAKARREPLTEDEAKQLEEALRTHHPWLEWAGKAEQDTRGFFAIDPVALHIHERVSAQPSSRSPSAKTSSATCSAIRSWTITRPSSSTATTWTGPTA